MPVFAGATSDVFARVVEFSSATFKGQHNVGTLLVKACRGSRRMADANTCSNPRVVLSRTEPADYCFEPLYQRYRANHDMSGVTLSSGKYSAPIGRDQPKAAMRGKT